MISPEQFRNKHLVIVGLKGAGKTNFIKWLLRYYPRHLIFDVLREHKGFNRYLPTHRQRGEELNQEFNLLLNKVVIPKREKLDVFGVDEANRIFPNREKMPAAGLDLIDFSRHWSMCIAFIARRLAQLHTDVVETANYVVAFKQTGFNDLRRLASLMEGLDDVMREKISFQEHNFILFDGNSFSIEKVPKMD